MNSSMNSSDVIVCKNLAVGYGGKTVASGISFAIKQGDFLSVTGKNGSGKTTLIKSMLGLLPLIGGEILTPERLKPGDISYLGQKNDEKHSFPATVREVVFSGLIPGAGARIFFTKAEKNFAEEVMEKMRIKELAEKNFGKISGGQQQRALLARAFCAAKKIIFLDEASTGLDNEMESDFYMYLKKLQSSGEGPAVVMVSHDHSAVLKYSSHVLCLDEPKFFGSVDEYRSVFTVEGRGA